MASRVLAQQKLLSLSLSPWEERLLLRLRQLQGNGVRYVRIDLLDKAIVEKVDAKTERLDNNSQSL